MVFLLGFFLRFFKGQGCGEKLSRQSAYLLGERSYCVKTDYLSIIFFHSVCIFF